MTDIYLRMNDKYKGIEQKRRIFEAYGLCNVHGLSEEDRAKLHRSYEKARAEYYELLAHALSSRRKYD